MPVEVGTWSSAAFVALFLCAALIIGTVVARRRGHLRSRGAMLAIAVIVALLVLFGLGGPALIPLI